MQEQTSYINYFRTLNLRTQELKYQKLLEHLKAECEKAIANKEFQLHIKIDADSQQLYFDTENLSLYQMTSELRDFAEFAKDYYNLIIHIFFHNKNSSPFVDAKDFCTMSVFWEQQRFTNKPPTYKLVAESGK